MKPEELEKISLRVERLFYDLQNRVLDDIVRRIRKTGEITSTADYQIEKLYQFGNSTEFIEKEIKRTLKASDAELWELYDKVIDKEYTRNKRIYEQLNMNFIPYDKNPVMQAWTKALIAQTRNELVNLTNSLGFMVDLGGGKKAFTPLATYYQKYLDRACMDIVTGAFDYNTVLRRVTKEMTSSGIRTVSYASGYTNRITVASRRAVMTGVHQLAAKMNEQVSKDLGTNTYEVEWHRGARPDHWWGGLILTMEDLIRICHLGEVTGLCGANCYHSYHAFIPGVSVPTWSKVQLQEMNAREQESHAWQGKEYNAYTATQKQRQFETTMRAQRSRIDLLKKGNADPDTIIAAQAKYLNTLHQYQGLSKQMKLPTQMERVYLDQLGRMVGSKIPAMKRRTKNIGEFKDFSVSMQLRNVKRIADKYGVKLDDLTVKIQRDPILINLFYSGSTDYDSIGRVDLFPKAFTSEEALVRTLIHERSHVLQLRKYGKEYTQINLVDMENQAYKFEEFWYNKLRKKVR